MLDVQGVLARYSYPDRYLLNENDSYLLLGRGLGLLNTLTNHL